MKKPQFLVLCTLTVAIISWVVHIRLQEPDPLPRRNTPRAVSAPSKSTPSRAIRKVALPGLSTGSDAMTVRATAPNPDHPGMEDPRARRVETRAKEHLARLDGNLQLSKDQERRIFPILARHDPEFQPSMMIGSESPASMPRLGSFVGPGPGPARAPASGPLATTPRGETTAPASVERSPSTASNIPGGVPNKAPNNVSSVIPSKVSTDVPGNISSNVPATIPRSETSPQAPTEQASLDPSVAIMNELTPQQQAAYEDSLIDEGLWWSAIIAQIESEYRKDLPTAVASPEVIPDEGGGENLFDIIGR